MAHHHHSHGNHSSTRIAWAFFLNLGFSVIEFVGGWLTNSTAIMADAVHDLGDSLSIGFGWLLSRLGERPANDVFSYGYRRFTLLGALLNGVVLVVGSVWVLREALSRLQDPQMPIAEGMLGMAVFGIVVNGFAAWKLREGRSLNERVLNWHLLEDVLGWVAVLLVSVLLLFVDWPILDPLLSIVFSLFILINVARMLWQTGNLFLQASPDRTLRATIEERLRQLDHVSDIHHLHVWSLDGEHHVLSVHVVVADCLELPSQMALKGEIARALAGLGLLHTTVELEFPDEFCRDPGSHRDGSGG